MGGTGLRMDMMSILEMSGIPVSVVVDSEVDMLRIVMMGYEDVMKGDIYVADMGQNGRFK